MSIRSEKIFAQNHIFLGGLLESVGFVCEVDGEYLRLGSDGVDRVFVDADPKRGRFAILMSFYPKSLQVIEDLYPKTGEPRGFPCGPYLTQVGVIRRPYWWSCKTSDVLTASCERVGAAMRLHGLPWLDGLRDPKLFAQAVDPNGALYAGYAHELAGDFVAARERYEDMLERLVGIRGMNISEEKFLSSVGKEFLFVVQKLGVSELHLDRYKTLLAMPYVEPLPQPD